MRTRNTGTDQMLKEQFNRFFRVSPQEEDEGQRCVHPHVFFSVQQSTQGHLRPRGGAVLLIKVILVLTCHNDVNVDDGSIKIFRDLHVDVFYR